MRHIAKRRGLWFVSTGLLLLAAAGCSTINSRLWIKPQNIFVLGGGQEGSFTVEAENVGAAPVSIASRAPDGKSTPMGVLDPGASQTVNFDQGMAAVLTNMSDAEEARVVVRVTGDTNLGMRYQQPTQR